MHGVRQILRLLEGDARAEVAFAIVEVDEAAEFFRASGNIAVSIPVEVGYRRGPDRTFGWSPGFAVAIQVAVEINAALAFIEVLFGFYRVSLLTLAIRN
ncbi:MAG: hypothetical protein QM757_08470 [Paludibaculum sp.]